MRVHFIKSDFFTMPASAQGVEPAKWRPDIFLARQRQKSPPT